MADEYMILESKMNHLTIEELDKLDPDFITPIVNKLFSLKQNFNRKDIKDFKVIGSILSGSDAKNPSRGFKMPIGVYYCTNQERYIATRFIKSKKYFIKSSSDPEVVIKAVKEFASKHKLKVYG